MKRSEEWRKTRAEAAAAHYFAEPEYIEYWLKRVKAKCTISDNGCWLWTGVLRPIWYYAFTTYRGKSVAVHRKMYELVHGVSLTRQQYVCHTCDVRHCCNPDHLWLGTNSDNQLDASRKGRHAEVKVTHCPQGHEYAGDNLILVPRRGGKVARRCRTCVQITRSSVEWKTKQRERVKRWRQKQREQRV